jgi:hypothetical protein
LSINSVNPSDFKIGKVNRRIFLKAKATALNFFFDKDLGQKNY